RRLPSARAPRTYPIEYYSHDQRRPFSIKSRSTAARCLIAPARTPDRTTTHTEGAHDESNPRRRKTDRSLPTAPWNLHYSPPRTGSRTRVGAESKPAAASHRYRCDRPEPTRHVPSSHQ